jgi:hypothetical protein
LFRVESTSKGRTTPAVEFIAIDCALFPEHTPATIEELPAMGYDW